MLSLLLGAGTGVANEWHDPIFGQTAGQFLFSVFCFVVVAAVCLWALRRLGIL